jgi:beta-lactamase superfamily II metal-dependent hydrolase
MSDATIRMYNVGFGDAFLLQLPTDGGVVKVLFDCGSHAASARPRPMSEVVAQILEDVRDGDGTPRIDVVVGTHRHQDHVSGFENEHWSEVEVREVWMPWTEDPDDPEATRIRERQSATAERLTAALAADGAHPDLLELAENQLTNAKAMATLHKGFAGSPRRRFLPAGGPGDDLSDSPLSKFRVHVLGPARDERVIRDMDPPAGEAYLRMIGLNIADEPPLAAPFANTWILQESDFARSKAWQHLRLDGNGKKRVHAVATDDRLAVAVALDKAVNGTSLVIAFELGDAVLLFPADAQWGSWDYILSDAEHRALVARTTFLKVGHHGSHNATPRDFVELLGRDGAANDEFAAMVSTHKMKRWPKIPKKELLEALNEVTPRVARSDRGAGAPVAGFDHWSADFIDLRVPLGPGGN